MTTIKTAQKKAHAVAEKAKFDTLRSDRGYGFCMTYNDLDTLVADILTTHSHSILKALEERYTAKVQKRNGRTSSKGGVANIRRKARNRMLMDALTIANELLTKN